MLPVEGVQQSGRTVNTARELHGRGGEGRGEGRGEGGEGRGKGRGREGRGRGRVELAQVTQPFFTYYFHAGRCY